MNWALVNESGIVENIIEYDGVEPYIPADGLSLLEINDWIDISDHKDAAKKPPVLVDEVEAKIRRNNYLSEDLSLKATFRIEKRVNPALNFSDYIDTLEAEKI